MRFKVERIVYYTSLNESYKTGSVRSISAQEFNSMTDYDFPQESPTAVLDVIVPETDYSPSPFVDTEDRYQNSPRVSPTTKLLFLEVIIRLSILKGVNLRRKFPEFSQDLTRAIPAGDEIS
ncbi:UNVERIFIED_CONTAM: hypothetical protein PYX00_000881 [Menopon gallinae]|uniref:Uncharacterized protein n=1 Tax=Menopon gallinae TaxID=328185 RepID=A0AAW2IAV7_9NEOP